MARVVLENVSKVFAGPKGEPVHAVLDLTLAVDAAELVVLVGPSGSGKTTTLRLIAGLEDLTSGTISIDGRVVNTVEPKDRDVAMVFQNHALYPHMTVGENLAFGLKLRKFPKREIEARVREATELLGLATLLDRLPAALSGGERQRVALGRALVRKPKVLLLDEPLSNLDAPLRARLRAEIARLQRRLGVPMVYVTHDQAEALALGDRIVVMRDGVIQQTGAPMEIYQRPANLFVAGFIGSPAMNLFAGVLRAGAGRLYFEAAPDEASGAPAVFAVRLNEGTEGWLGERVGREVVLGLRQEHIVSGADTRAADPEQTIEARVERIEPLGAETYVHFTSGPFAFVARSYPQISLVAGQKLTLAFDLRHANFFDPGSGVALPTYSSGCGLGDTSGAKS